jgi:hypothetical protein
MFVFDERRSQMKRVMIAAAFVAFQLCLPMKAQAQSEGCLGKASATRLGTIGSNSYIPPSSVVGYSALVNSFWADRCVDGYLQSEAWYLGAPFAPSCSVTGQGSTGGPYVGWSCYGVSPTPPVVGVAYGARAELLAYGCWEVRSKHWHVRPQGWWLWGYGEVPTYACGGERPADPSTEECEYQWDEEAQNWELSWCPSPIIMPIGSDKRQIKQKDYRLTDPARGVLFDLNGDGKLELVAWTARGSKLAFLALDRNGNGTIDTGAELFGNHTLPGAGNGFDALSRSTPCKGLVREGCALYEQLLLWEDDNHDGISAPEELHKFSDHYLGISGGYVDDDLKDKYGNEFRFRGTAAVRDPGKSKHYPIEDPGADVGLLIPIWDVFLRGR